MGYHIEVNSIVRLSDEVDRNALKVGQKLSITLDRERILPLRIALLFFHGDWNFYGYCRVNQTAIKDQKTYLEMEILTLFNESEKKLYREKFIEAGKFTGEAK